MTALEQFSFTFAQLIFTAKLVDELSIAQFADYSIKFIYLIVVLGIQKAICILPQYQNGVDQKVSFETNIYNLIIIVVFISLLMVAQTNFWIVIYFSQYMVYEFVRRTILFRQEKIKRVLITSIIIMLLNVHYYFNFIDIHLLVLCLLLIALIHLALIINLSESSRKKPVKYVLNNLYSHLSYCINFLSIPLFIGFVYAEKYVATYNIARILFQPITQLNSLIDTVDKKMFAILLRKDIVEYQNNRRNQLKKMLTVSSVYIIIILILVYHFHYYFEKYDIKTMFYMLFYFSAYNLIYPFYYNVDNSKMLNNTYGELQKLKNAFSILVILTIVLSYYVHLDIYLFITIHIVTYALYTKSVVRKMF
jgi:hypothetical protein